MIARPTPQERVDMRTMPPQERVQMVAEDPSVLDRYLDALEAAEAELAEALAREAALKEPYHECVSLTYNPPEKWPETILRIRRRLKTAIGWWTSHDELLEEAALSSPASGEGGT